MTRRSLSGSRVVVTGASGGIGREIALEAARRGARLLLTARNSERLQETARAAATSRCEVQVVVGDITSPDVRQSLIDGALQSWGGIDVLVNNAGVGAHGPFHAASPERLRRIMEVNFFAPIELIRLALPLLRSGRNPLIANVSSVLGHRAVPMRSEYCASKFALHGFSDALRAELAREGIGVLLISPSSTATEFTEHLLERCSQKRVYGRPMTAAAVARKSVQAIESGKDELILSPGGTFLVWIDRLCPPLANWLVARFG